MDPPNPPPPPLRPLKLPSKIKHLPEYKDPFKRSVFSFAQSHPTQFHGLPDPKEQQIESRLIGLNNTMQDLKIHLDAILKLFIPPRIAKANPSVKSAFHTISRKMSRHTDESSEESFKVKASILYNVASFMERAAELFDMIHPKVEMMMGLSSSDPRVSLVQDIVRLIDVVQNRVPLDRLEVNHVYAEIMMATNRHGGMKYHEIHEKLDELVFPEEEAFIQNIINAMKTRVRGDAIKCRRLIQILMDENELMSHPLMNLFKKNKAVYAGFFYPGDKLQDTLAHYEYKMRDQHQIISKMCGKNITSWNIPLDQSTTLNDLITNDSPYSDKVNRLFVFGRKEHLGKLPKDIAENFEKFQKDEVLWLKSGGKPRYSKCRKTRRTKTRKS